jgi:hypothetical protein
MTDDAMELAREPDEEIAGGDPDDNREDTEPEELEAHNGQSDEADDDVSDEDDDSGDQGDEGGEEESEDAEFAEIEVDGKTYKVPSQIKDGYMRHADYTRKTQEVADQRRSVEQYEEKARQIAEISQAEFGHAVTAQKINEQLEQYKQVDWNALEQEDPIGAQQHWRQFQMLKDQHQEAVQSYQQAHNERTQMAQQATAKRIEETREFASKNIPGWSEELDDKITKFATSEFSRDELAQAMNPKIYRMLHLAWIGQQTLDQAKAAKKPKPATQPKPTSKVKARGNPAGRKPIGEMSMDEYAAYRNRQEARKKQKAPR